MANHLGQYLRSLRQTKGLTTRQLGDMAGCSHSFITLLEAGERFPSLDRLWRIVKALDGDYSQAVSFLSLDSGVPEEIAREMAAQGKIKPS